MGILDKFVTNKPDAMMDPLGMRMQSPIPNPNLASYNERLKMLAMGDNADVKPQYSPIGAMPPVGTQAPNNPQQTADPSMMSKFGSFLGDNRDLINKIGAGYFALSQDPQLQQFGMAKAQEIAKTSQATKARNQTVEALRKAGRDDLAKAVESGMMPATEAAKLLYSGGDMKVVGKSAIRFNPLTGKVDVLYSEQGGDDEATAAFRTLQARAEAAGLKAGTQEYAQFMIDGGTKSGFAMRMNADGSVEFVQGSGTLKPLNEMQAKATGFYGRMVLNSSIIDKLETQGTQIFDNVVKGIPFAGNFLTSPEYKQYMYAKDNWIAAQLRDESGAAIGTDEYWNADKQYFPQMGDSAEVIEQKRQRRKAAEEAMKTKSGTGVKESSETPSQKTIKIGDIVNGYRYKGGDPKQQSSWEKI